MRLCLLTHVNRSHLWPFIPEAALILEDDTGREIHQRHDDGHLGEDGQATHELRLQLGACAQWGEMMAVVEQSVNRGVGDGVITPPARSERNNLPE